VLSAGDHIRNLLGRYCAAVDAGDWEAVGALFARGALATDDGTVLAAGAGAVADFYRRATLLHDGSPRTTHVVADTVVDLADPGVDPAGPGVGSEAPVAVLVRSTYVVFQALEDFPLQPIITGRYEDRFACGLPDDGDGDGEGDGSDGGAGRLDGGWHFTERRFAVDLLGDVSRHLAFEL
jgi:hypothetical protein